MIPAWWCDWADETCVIVGSGQSAKAVNVESVRGRYRVIVINNGYKLAPWADVLYAADGSWWREHAYQMDFAGLKLTACPHTAGVLKIGLVHMANGEGKEEESEITVARHGFVGRGGNSGFQALNLAVQFGCRRIYLVGFDLCGDHWHPPHQRRPQSPRPAALARWARTLDRQRPILDRLGLEVINCSKTSALTAYQTGPLE